MPLFTTNQPSLRARVLPRFPANVIAGPGISITKSGGTYTFSGNFSNIPIESLADISSDRLLGRDSAGSGPPEQLTVGAGLQFTGAGGIQVSQNNRFRQLTTVLYNNGAVLTTGIKADLEVPWSCTLIQVTLLADQSGSIVVDIWKAPYVSYPPVVGNKITGSTPPTISGAVKAQDFTLTGWTTALTIGDILRFNINSIATLTRVTVSMIVLTV